MADDGGFDHHGNSIMYRRIRRQLTFKATISTNLSSKVDILYDFLLMDQQTCQVKLVKIKIIGKTREKPALNIHRSQIGSSLGSWVRMPPDPRPPAARLHMPPERDHAETTLTARVFPRYETHAPHSGTDRRDDEVERV